jgi:hypothetical protein
MRGRFGKSKRELFGCRRVGYVDAMVCFGLLLDKDDPQRFVWFGSAASNGESFFVLKEMFDRALNFNSGAGHANVVFVIGRALKGNIENEKRTIFGNGDSFDACISPANQAFQFYEFQLQL